MSGCYSTGLLEDSVPPPPPFSMRIVGGWFTVNLLPLFYVFQLDTPDSEPDSLTTRITNLEKTYGSIIEDGFKELKNDLKSELKHELMTMEKSMDRSFATCNNRINDLSSWNQWIIGTICTGVMFKVVFYDRYTEEKLMAKILDSETRITTMVQNALIQLKLELRINQ
ncbi:hypothetical protein L873DRAFT_1789909 [Choiromyces venosus 120613-1]|uniref:Uncharacterized protein n=1 Tax=Choiromyces venosus 120613-1 TaxID=1336337 RepID=A0A3N4JL36_9PEZI|nr:hypothetical protein L873DRAFT_1789909 [Choiromyces venosus 120613-1]